MVRTKYMVMKKENQKCTFSVIGVFFHAQNWIKNSLRIHDSTLQDQVWDVFSEATRNVSLTGGTTSQNGNALQNVGRKTFQTPFVGVSRNIVSHSSNGLCYNVVFLD